MPIRRWWDGSKVLHIKKKETFYIGIIQAAKIAQSSSVPLQPTGWRRKSPFSAGLGRPWRRRVPGPSHLSALFRSLGGVTAACEGVPGPGSLSRADPLLASLGPPPPQDRAPWGAGGPPGVPAPGCAWAASGCLHCHSPGVCVRSARGKPGMLCDEERTEPGRCRVLDSVLGSSTWHGAPKDGSPALRLQRWLVNPSLFT